MVLLLNWLGLNYLCGSGKKKSKLCRSMIKFTVTADPIYCEFVPFFLTYILLSDIYTYFLTYLPLFAKYWPHHCKIASIIL